MTIKRSCMYCRLPGGFDEGEGEVELRPYGPNGEDVCFPCAMDTDHPERKTTAEGQLARRLLGPSPLILRDDEQVGPRPMTDADIEDLDAAVKD